jgi:chemotaxis protein histidine kinase CheA
MSNTFDKLSVLDSFIEEVNSYLPEIEANIGRLAQSTDDMEALEETYRRAHTIGGSASMMDFPGLAHVAHGMEDILGDVLDNLTTLDAPTLGLLQRSLQRMHRLVNGIHKGIDEDAVIAEDDADYTQYRSLMEASARGVERAKDAEGNVVLEEQAVATTSPLASSPMIPTLDEVLASFRTPSVSLGEDVSWPEEPLPVSSADVRSQQDTQPKQPVSTSPTASMPVTDQAPSEPAPAAPSSALEMLATASRRASEPPPLTPGVPEED